MTDGDVYDAVDRHGAARQDCLYSPANVVASSSNYRETFIDEEMLI
jgi:hypothetical protein